MPYPSLGFAEDYIDTPQTTKRGFIVPVTKEAIFFDRTHLILQRAAEVGEVLGLNKEKRLLDLLIGATNNYKWKGAAYNTYSSAGTGVAPDGNWINQMTEELVDWTDVDAAEQLFADILDPNTGEPVLIQATTVLVMPAYRHAAHRIFNAAEINYAAGGSATTTVAANPLGNYTVVESRLAYRRLIAAGHDGRGGQEVVVHRRLPQGLRLHGELADHRHAIAAEQRGRVQPGHRGPLQGQRAGGPRRSSIPATSSRAPAPAAAAEPKRSEHRQWATRSVILDEQNYGGPAGGPYWPLDEANGGRRRPDDPGPRRGNNGTLMPNSGGGTDGTLDNRPGPLAREGGWANFNGTSGYVNCGTMGTLGGESRQRRDDGSMVRHHCRGHAVRDLLLQFAAVHPLDHPRHARRRLCGWIYRRADVRWLGAKLAGLCTPRSRNVRRFAAPPCCGDRPDGEDHRLLL